MLIVSHESWLDIIALAPLFCISRRMTYVAKKELWHIHPFISWWLDTVGTIKLDRETSDRIAIEKAVNVLKTNNILVIFPEGSRIKAFDKKWDIEEGAALIAQMAQKDFIKNNRPENMRPILYPVTICYHDQKRIILGKITYIDVVVGKPIEIDINCKRKQYTQLLANRLKTLYNRSLDNMFPSASSTKLK